MDNPNAIKDTALSLLARRDHSQQELTQKLRMKGYSPSAIQSLLPALIESGYLNDLRFAENYIPSRRRKGYGPLRIFMELQARGVADEMIAECLDITDNAWFTEARNVWQKRFKGNKPSDFKHRAKQMRFLQYRGFTQEQIESVYENPKKSCFFNE